MSRRHKISNFTVPNKPLQLILLVVPIDFNSEEFLDHISLDCVVFGFHDKELKILSMHLKQSGQYALPGGFLKKNETIEKAVNRVLKSRTSLDQIFLRQFQVFSEPSRSRSNPALKDLESSGMDPDMNFFNKRFISIGFYALVDYTKVNPVPDFFSDRCEWKNVDEPVLYMLDHRAIIEQALTALRLQLNHQPIGYNLLPEEFTMPELQKLYESILGKELDRRNFQRKILSYNILDRLNERRKGGANRAPYLYRFNPDNYRNALKEGLRGGW